MARPFCTVGIEILLKDYNFQWFYFFASWYKSAQFMASGQKESALQYEIDQLKGVRLRLDSLASAHPSMEVEIMSISGNVRSNAVLLELLLALKIRPAEM